MAKNKHIGSTLDDFLKEEGCLEEFTAAAIKEVFAWQIAQRMKDKGISKFVMAGRMRTSRSQLDRLLDPTDGNVTLETMQRAASVLGEVLTVGFGPQEESKNLKMGKANWEAVISKKSASKVRRVPKRNAPAKGSRALATAAAHKE